MWKRDFPFLTHGRESYMESYTWKPSALTCNRCNGLNQDAGPRTHELRGSCPVTVTATPSTVPKVRSPPQPFAGHLRGCVARATAREAATSKQPYRAVSAPHPRTPLRPPPGPGDPAPAISVGQRRSRAGEASGKPRPPRKRKADEAEEMRRDH